jgi:hypothetical protein
VPFFSSIVTLSLFSFMRKRTSFMVRSCAARARGAATLQPKQASRRRGARSWLASSLDGPLSLRVPLA